MLRVTASGRLPGLFPSAVRRGFASAVHGLAPVLRNTSQSRVYRTRSVVTSATASAVMKKEQTPAEFLVPDSEKWWTDQTVAIVTGGNKGIGWEICRILSQQGLRTVLAARDAQRGQQAVKEIQAISGGSNTQLTFAQLDIDDPKSVEAFGAWAEKELHTVDILVNNAGFAYKGDVFGPQEARHTMDVNFIGTKAVCERLIPLMKKGGRIVNVSSGSGRLAQLKSPELLKRFETASTPDDVMKLANEWLDAVEDGSYSKKGWSSSMYNISKMCETTYTRVLADQLISKGISANACNPGYTATDMSSWKGFKHASEGADTPAWLALLAPQKLTGKYVSEREVQPP